MRLLQSVGQSFRLGVHFAGILQLANANFGYLHEINDGFQKKKIIDNWIGFYNS